MQILYGNFLLLPFNLNIFTIFMQVVYYHDCLPGALYEVDVIRQQSDVLSEMGEEPKMSLRAWRPGQRDKVILPYYGGKAGRLRG